MLCKHKWELISETTTKSKFENACEAIDVNTMKNYENIKIPHQLSCSERKHIQIVTCSKCGKLKRFVENI